MSMRRAAGRLRRVLAVRGLGRRPATSAATSARSGRPSADGHARRAPARRGANTSSVLSLRCAADASSVAFANDSSPPRSAASVIGIDRSVSPCAPAWPPTTGSAHTGTPTTPSPTSHRHRPTPHEHQPRPPLSPSPPRPGTAHHRAPAHARRAPHRSTTQDRPPTPRPRRGHPHRHDQQVVGK